MEGIGVQWTGARRFLDVRVLCEPQDILQSGPAQLRVDQSHSLLPNGLPLLVSCRSSRNPAHNHVVTLQSANAAFQKCKDSWGVGVEADGRGVQLNIGSLDSVYPALARHP